MWSSSSSDTTNNKITNCLSSITSKSSTSSSPSYSTNPSRTMEEVWKDITLSSLPPNNHLSLQDSHFNLQDFLARPFSNKPPTTFHHPHNRHASAVYASPPPPATLLNLNSGQYFNLIMPPNPSTTVHPSFAAAAAAAAADHHDGVPYDGSVGLIGQNRCPDSDGIPGDRRHKRMIKNRESAARSRARKQAYTNELELERDALKQEIKRLREQQSQFLAAADAQFAQKRTLQRTSTAPF